jgi:hypothetical protein
VRLEASTKPPIYNLIHEFLINLAFTCPNFKKGLKMAFGPLGVNLIHAQVPLNTSIIVIKSNLIRIFSSNFKTRFSLKTKTSNDLKCNKYNSR